MNKRKLIDELKTHQLFISAMDTEKDEHISAGVGIAIDLIKKHESWISVKDELPSETGEYLVFGFYDFDEKGYEQKFEYFFKSDNAFFDDPNFTITHWQDSPPPKEINHD